MITIGEKKYDVGNTILGTLTERPLFTCEESPDYIPVLIINAVGPEAWAENLIKDPLTEDDVISFAFTERIILRVSITDCQDLRAREANPKKYHYDSAIEADLRNGPYFLHGRDLYKCYRLYEDIYNAFVCGVVQSEAEPISFQRNQDQQYVPVPSRCYFPLPTLGKPLSGKRIAVKDIYDLRGVPTSAGCTTYGLLHGPAKSTAACIQTLLDKGAVVVAKAKTVQFASGMASADWVHDICPTNPRGCGNLDTDCSSSGSAAAIAGYGWLDYSIGSDSLGSITGPAAACGVLGLRPSFGALSNAGAVPVSSHLDIPGFFCRSIEELICMAEVWLRPLESVHDIGKKPTSILVPEEKFINPSMNTFVKCLEEYCGAAKTVIGHNDLSRDFSDGLDRHVDLDTYLHTVIADIQLHDCFQNALKSLKVIDGDSLIDVLKEIDPLIAYKWFQGQNVTQESYAIALERKEAFHSFLRTKVFTKGTIMILPGSSVGVRYRDEKTPECRYRSWQGFGFKNTTYAVLGGLPAVVFPVGQHVYKSRITEKFVRRPISVMVVGPPGADVWLIKQLAKVLFREAVDIGSDLLIGRYPRYDTGAAIRSWLSGVQAAASP